jgi:ABC-type Mn2+/Zn2+ transport system ATPase subunit
MAYLEVKNVSFSYQQHLVLEDISFTLNKGSVSVIVGPNGAGKSTLLQVIMGLYKADKGEVKIDGQKPNSLKHKIAYVPQKFNFDANTPVTVFEFMSLEKCSYSKHRPVYISKFLNQVGLKNIEKKKLGELSGGQMQRAMIARALLHEKDLLIFDEPASGIDISGEKTIYQLIKEISIKNKATCLIVAHHLDQVAQYADNLICLNKKMTCFQEIDSSFKIEGHHHKL